MVENTNGGGKQPPRKSFLYYYGLVMLIVMLLNIFLFPSMMDRTQQVRFDQFSDQLKEDNVDEVYVTTNNEIVYTLKNDNKNTAWNVTYKTGEIPGVNLYDLLDGKDVKYSAEINTQASPLLNFLLTWILPLILFVGIGQLMGRSLMKRMGGGPGNAMTFGKSNAKIYAESETGITFADVAGEEEAKDALKEIVDFLHKPEKYSEIGAVLPKGALLVGPPGTGKTMLAKAVAGEAHVPFFSISGSEFVEMFVGMGAAKVRDLFKQANEKAPCIVFIDEIDTIGKKRDGAGMGGNDEREQTLNQLLTEMDGFDGKKGVVILAATNRPESLDPALLRPGRFDRRIPVELPDLKGREAILKVHGKKVKVDESVDYNEIARATNGASGAELANIVNEAALRAVRMGRKTVSQQDLEESVETVIAGYQKKDAGVSGDEKKIVSYHEIGHALVAALQTHSAPVHKITIVPRTSGALGYTMQVEADQRFLMSREEAFNKIVTLTGGRAAEELIFHSITTGASNDIEQATKIARAMVTRYGMSDHFGMVALETVNNAYLGGDTSLACSAETAARVDEEVIALVKSAYEKAKAILSGHEDKLHELADYLLDKETITGEEFMKILEEKKEAGEAEAKTEPCIIRWTVTCLPKL
ncbi:ATP-dependent metallopeptidase FtsH/Yme1/Tma family protein [Clostridium sp. OF13-4]|nr:ATP-dependent metallopeptidase FtsH/Yme1/Tma family protein [Clostridium sp. OF13-4]